jgi:hypothetical protein
MSIGAAVNTALIAIVALLGSVGLAHAQADDERMQMLMGGARRSSFNFFGLGGSDATRSRVSYRSREGPGTIVVHTAERRLYLVQGDGSALRYTIGVGRAGFQWKEASPRCPPRRSGQAGRRRRICGRASAACRLIWPAAKTTPSVRAPYISAVRSIEFMARTIRIGLVKPTYRCTSLQRRVRAERSPRLGLYAEKLAGGWGSD